MGGGNFLIAIIMSKYWWMKIQTTSNSITVGSLSDQVETGAIIITMSYDKKQWELMAMH